MTKPTKEKIVLALEQSIIIWEWLAEVGTKDKENCPHIDTRQFRNFCPLCDLAGRTCFCCPVRNELNQCVTDSIYGHWVDSHSSEQLKEIAKSILNILKTKLQEITAQ